MNTDLKSALENFVVKTLENSATASDAELAAATTIAVDLMRYQY